MGLLGWMRFAVRGEKRQWQPRESPRGAGGEGVGSGSLRGHTNGLSSHISLLVASASCTPCLALWAARPPSRPPTRPGSGHLRKPGLAGSCGEVAEGPHPTPRRPCSSSRRQGLSCPGGPRQHLCLLLARANPCLPACTLRPPSKTVSSHLSPPRSSSA